MGTSPASAEAWASASASRMKCRSSAIGSTRIARRPGLAESGGEKRLATVLDNRAGWQETENMKELASWIFPTGFLTRHTR